MTQRPYLSNNYLAVIFRQCISGRLAEGMLTGMALESLTAANLADVPQRWARPGRIAGSSRKTCSKSGALGLLPSSRAAPSRGGAAGAAGFVPAAPACLARVS
jgi:hypothetical protein